MILFNYLMDKLEPLFDRIENYLVNLKVKVFVTILNKIDNINAKLQKHNPALSLEDKQHNFKIEPLKQTTCYIFKTYITQLQLDIKKQASEMVILTATLRALNASLADIPTHCEKNIFILEELSKPLVEKLYKQKKVTHLSGSNGCARREVLEIVCTKQYQQITSEDPGLLSENKILELILITNALVLKTFKALSQDQGRPNKTVLITLETKVNLKNQKQKESQESRVYPITSDLDFWASVDPKETIIIINNAFTKVLSRVFSEPSASENKFEQLTVTFISKPVTQRPLIKNLNLKLKKKCYI